MVNVKGSQITANRDGKTRVRDAQKFKRVRIVSPKRYERIREPFILHSASDTDFGFSVGTTANGAAVNGAAVNGAMSNVGSANGGSANDAPAIGASRNGASTNSAAANDASLNGATQQGRGRLTKTLRKQQLLRNLHGTGGR